ncbi:MAG: phosphoribosylglycinamide synthetase C domain-containing protein, partial [Pyrinomonadaceae bacterium]
VSLIMFCDGKNFALMPPVRDHKRIGEGDTGANTGGMGTVSDADLLNEKQTTEIVNQIIKPTLEGCEKEGFPFKGIIFLGLMMTSDGAKVLEYNVRFGDPETQVILIQLESDFVEICQAMLSESLDQIKIKWKNGSAACVVLASKGYPSKAATGDVIKGLKNISEDVEVFHAGTGKNENGEFITAGGRVLGITATAENLPDALNKVYAVVDKIKWNGMQFRRDIGQ